MQTIICFVLNQDLFKSLEQQWKFSPRDRMQMFSDKFCWKNLGKLSNDRKSIDWRLFRIVFEWRITVAFSQFFHQFSIDFSSIFLIDRRSKKFTKTLTIFHSIFFSFLQFSLIRKMSFDLVSKRAQFITIDYKDKIIKKHKENQLIFRKMKSLNRIFFVEQFFST